ELGQDRGHAAEGIRRVQRGPGRTPSQRGPGRLGDLSERRRAPDRDGGRQGRDHPGLQRPSRRGRVRRVRAPLLGRAESRDRSSSSLPCVTSDINQLVTAFEARGYVVEGTENSGRVDRSDLRRLVREFLESAKPDDTLVIYLSGHGAFHDGVTYLLPHD